MNELRLRLDSIYLKYNKFELIHPDPLEFIYDYASFEDREIAALVASSLAYGRVAQILISVKKILSLLGPKPAETLRGAYFEDVDENLTCFKHRFTTGREIFLLLKGVKRSIEKYGSLKECFFKNKTDTHLQRVCGFVRDINYYFENNKSYLLPSPEDHSACKRLMLFLKWMIRKDEVDPGTWETPSAAGDLIMPLDTHIYQISKKLCLTTRKSADLKTALEISRAFREINPEDPVKYDFALTRFGIRDDMDYQSLFESICG